MNESNTNTLFITGRKSESFVNSRSTLQFNIYVLGGV